MRVQKRRLAMTGITAQPIKKFFDCWASRIDAHILPIRIALTRSQTTIKWNFWVNCKGDIFVTAQLIGEI